MNRILVVEVSALGNCCFPAEKLSFPQRETVVTLRGNNRYPSEELSDCMAMRSRGLWKIFWSSGVFSFFRMIEDIH